MQDIPCVKFSGSNCLFILARKQHFGHFYHFQITSLLASFEHLKFVALIMTKADIERRQ